MQQPRRPPQRQGRTTQDWQLRCRSTQRMYDTIALAARFTHPLNHMMTSSRISLLAFVILSGRGDVHNILYTVHRQASSPSKAPHRKPKYSTVPLPKLCCRILRFLLCFNRLPLCFGSNSLGFRFNLSNVPTPSTEGSDNFGSDRGSQRHPNENKRFVDRVCQCKLSPDTLEFVLAHSVESKCRNPRLLAVSPMFAASASFTP